MNAKPKRGRGRQVLKPARLDVRRGDLLGQAQAIADRVATIDDQARELAAVLVSIERGKPFAIEVGRSRVSIPADSSEAREFFRAGLLLALDQLREVASAVDIARAIAGHADEILDEIALEEEMLDEVERERDLARKQVASLDSAGKLRRKISRARGRARQVVDAIDDLDDDRELWSVQDERERRDTSVAAIKGKHKK